jgi:hypothetical protein
VDKSTGVVQNDFAMPLKVGRSARDVYREMMRETVKPALRRLGFQVSGTTFTLPSTTHLAWIAIQQSPSNTWVRVEFTGSVQVISRAEWALRSASPAGTKAPSPIANNYVGWWARLGEVSAYQRDYWWSVWAGLPADDVASDLLAAIQDHALPALKSRIAE